MFQSVAVAALLFFIVTVLKMRMKRKELCLEKLYPPVAHIPEAEMFETPRTAYENALKSAGHVVGVWRKGRLEYIVDDELSHEVLTTDSSFSFEEGTADILNISYFHKLFGSFFTDLDDLVRNGITNRMHLIVSQVFPVFRKHVDIALRSTPNLENSETGGVSVDVFDLAHKSISEAMTLSILGAHFVNERNLAIIEGVADEIAVLTGIYQNTSKWARTFPAIWILFTWVRVISTSIFPFFRVLGPTVWKDIHSKKYRLKNEFQGEMQYDESVLEYLIRKHAKEHGGKMGLMVFLRIMSLILGIIFASVHQTASVVVWIVYELAVRPEYLPALREELFSCASIDASASTKQAPIGYDALQEAVLLDSFIREVFRTKGDSLSTCRRTTRDVALGGYTIPKGRLVIPMATLAHLNTRHHGPDAAVFAGARWVASGKQAVTVSPAYFPFGLGRWACPGRVLAVAELKMVVWAIIRRATPVLKGNSYRIIDPLNITSVSPVGECFLIPCKT